MRNWAMCKKVLAESHFFLKNVISGVIPRAPQWMQDHSLEWLYRWSKEPKRLFKRYAETNSKFIFYLIKEKVEKR